MPIQIVVQNARRACLIGKWSFHQKE